MTLKPDGVRACFDETGIAFLFAQRYHPGMRFAANVRRQLGFKTLFNLLGPITNPAGVTRQAIGVYDPKLVPTVAEALKELGSVHALVFSGTEGMDEIAPTGFTILSELKGGKISTGLFSADSVLPKQERDGERRGPSRDSLRRNRRRQARCRSCQRGGGNRRRRQGGDDGRRL